MAPPPTRPLLLRMARLALARGVPEADADDIVVSAYRKAADAYDPSRGDFEALWSRVVRNECIDWWRAAQQAPTPSGQLELVAAPTAASMEQVAANQRRLLDALDPDERRLFATWALQKHLPQGTLDAAGAAARLGLDVRSYNNAKRRLRDKIRRLAAAWGLAPRAFFSVADDEGPRRTGARHVG